MTKDEREQSETWDCPRCGDTYFFKQRNRREYCVCGTGLVARQLGVIKTPFEFSERESEYDKRIQELYGDCRLFRIVDGHVTPTTTDELLALDTELGNDGAADGDG